MRPSDEGAVDGDGNGDVDGGGNDDGGESSRDLEFEAGDLIFVICAVEGRAGWAVGKNTRTRLVGEFPWAWTQRTADSLAAADPGRTCCGCKGGCKTSRCRCFKSGVGCCASCCCVSCANGHGRNPNSASDEAEMSMLSKKTFLTNTAYMDRVIRFLYNEWQHVRSNVAAILISVSEKPDIGGALAFFSLKGGEKVISIWDLNESLIPLCSGVFQSWRLSQDALPFLKAMPFLLALFIAGGKPEVSEVLLMHINTLLYWEQHRPDLLKNMGLNTQMLDDIWIELHNAGDAGYFNNKGEATAEAFTKITSLLNLRYTTRDTRTAELGMHRKQQQAEVRGLVEKYSKQGWTTTKAAYLAWLRRHVKQLAEEAKVAITVAEGTAGTGRHRLLKGGSEGFSGALDRLVGHCSTYATYGGWESAQKAQDVTDAANDLGVNVGNCHNRKETAMALVAAGWTYFDYYIHKREAAAGNQGCGGKLDLYGVSC